MSVVRLTAVRETPLSVDEVLASVADSAAGGTAIFVGTVRDHADGRAVTGLEYSAHPVAEQVLRDVADGVAAAHRVIALAATHRIGDLKVGDVAVVVAAASAHRAEAFAACRAFIDELKERVPIWKRETLDSGDRVWVGM